MLTCMNIVFCQLELRLGALPATLILLFFIKILTLFKKLVVTFPQNASLIGIKLAL